MTRRSRRPIELEIGEPCALDGYWNLAGAKRAFGRLSYGGASTLYEVEITFDHDQDPKHQDEYGPAAHGQLVSGEDVTLLTPAASGRTGWSSGVESSRFVALGVVIGRTVRDSHDRVFDSSRLYMPDLEMWLDAAPLEGTVKDGLRFSRPEPVEVQLASTGGTLATGWNYNEETDETRWIFDFRSYLRYSKPGGLSVEDIETFASSARRVICLLSGNDANIGRLLGLVGDEKANILHGDTVRASRRPRSHREVLFSRRELGDAFPMLLDKAFTTYARYKSAVDLLDVARRPGQVVELRYLTSVIALEAFDRARCDQNFVPPADYERVRTAMVAAIPTDCDGQLRQALKHRLQFGNERSLGYRLGHLMQTLPERVREVLTGGRRVKDFVEEVKNARNHLVHWPVERNRIDAMTLDELSDRLTIWLHVCILVEMGLPAERVVDRMLEHFYWGFILRKRSTLSCE
jgi:hypothetical protein